MWREGRGCNREPTLHAGEVAVTQPGLRRRASRQGAAVCTAYKQPGRGSTHTLCVLRAQRRPA